MAVEARQIHLNSESPNTNIYHESINTPNMKTKAILFFVACAAVTLSFTFTSVKKHQKAEEKVAKNRSEAPVGGIALEDK